MFFDQLYDLLSMLAVLFSMRSLREGDSRMSVVSTLHYPGCLTVISMTSSNPFMYALDTANGSLNIKTFARPPLVLVEAFVVDMAAPVDL